MYLPKWKYEGRRTPPRFDICKTSRCNSVLAQRLSPSGCLRNTEQRGWMWNAVFWSSVGPHYLRLHLNLNPICKRLQHWIHVNQRLKLFWSRFEPPQPLWFAKSKYYYGGQTRGRSWFPSDLHTFFFFFELQSVGKHPSTAAFYSCFLAFGDSVLFSRYG